MLMMSKMSAVAIFIIFVLTLWNRIRLQIDFSMKKCKRYKNCSLALTFFRYLRMLLTLFSFFCNSMVFGISIKEKYGSFIILSCLFIGSITGLIASCFKELLYIQDLLVVLYDLFIEKN